MGYEGAGSWVAWILVYPLYSKLVYGKMFTKTRYLHLTSSSQLCEIICCLHQKVYYCMSNQTKLQIFRKSANKTSCNKLRAFCLIFLPRKEWCTGVTSLVSTTDFYVKYLPDGLMEQKGVGSFCFLKVLALQWNNHQHFLIYVCSKVTQNISDINEQYQNMQNGVSLFTRRFIHCNTFTLVKNSSNDYMWLVVI